MLYQLSIFLASNEWGNETMQALAIDAMQRNADKRPIVVYCYEHAGWALGFGLDTNTASPLIIASANDRAVYSDDAMAFRRRYAQAPITQLETIRRN